MSLDKEVAEKFMELEEKHKEGYNKLIPYQVALKGISNLKDKYKISSKSKDHTSITIRQKQLAGLSGILLKHLENWNGYSYFLFGDVYKDAKKRSKEIDKKAKISEGFTKNRISSIISELCGTHTQNGCEFEFKGAVHYIKNGKCEYGVPYYRLSGLT
ncbi:MAG: hypothetical protein UY34_C0040G0004 [Parcubacteria group bacterium GW2011_GWA2_48_9]|nr:MAG: hypothetical protein UY34_C0040G0004 [Parcubacteria group bacterium GW2011_GWA2_48_9]